MSKLFKDHIEKSTGSRPGLEVRESELSGIIRRRLGINLPNLIKKEYFVEKEIEQYVKTGNFDADVKMACLNPTLLSPDDQARWLTTDYFACPLFSYFPVPFDDLPSPDFHFGDKIYRYCKLRLQLLAIKLKKRKKRITFHFHWSDCLEQCIKDGKFKNRFQVIHCPEAVDGFGLINVLIATTGCLADTPESVLLTESRLFAFPKPTVIQYAEDGLCCPLPLVSTVYGVRLANNPQLGSSECYELHDITGISRHLHFVVTLRWLKVPTYSANIQLGVTEDLKRVIKKLVESCHFAGADKPPDENSLERSLPRPQTPLTFFYGLQSLLNRCNWIEGAAKSLIEESIPPIYQLAWKTFQNWSNGHPVFLLSTLNCLPPGKLNSNFKKNNFVRKQFFHLVLVVLLFFFFFF